MRVCYCSLQPRQMWLQKILMRSAEMPAVLELCWNNPCCPECPPGLMCDRKATAPGLPLVLEISVLYRYSLFLKRSMTKNHCKTKEVFIIALKDFGDPVHRAWLSHRHSSAAARWGR